MLVGTAPESKDKFDMVVEREEDVVEDMEEEDKVGVAKSGLSFGEGCELMCWVSGLTRCA